MTASPDTFASPMRPAQITDGPPWHVGFRQRALKFGRSRMPVAIWYPTAAVERTNFFGPFPMAVALDAPVAPGNGRLIVISHGSKGSQLGHRGTAMRLAAAGYTVAAPLHPGDNYLDDESSGTPGLWRDRAAHVSVTADAVMADPALGRGLTAADCGLIGFSLGGYTALRLLGACGSIDALLEHRRRHVSDTLPVAPGEPGLSLEQLEALRADWHDALVPARDERFRAAALLAPMCALFRDDELRGVDVPITLYCAERDDVLREPAHSHRLAALLPRLARFETVPAAGHFAFLTPFPGVLHKELPALACDAQDFDRPAFHDRLDQELLAFFDRALGAMPA